VDWWIPTVSKALRDDILRKWRIQASIRHLNGLGRDDPATWQAAGKAGS
jgi:hypothetical protein